MLQAIFSSGAKRTAKQSSTLAMVLLVAGVWACAPGAVGEDGEPVPNVDVPSRTNSNPIIRPPSPITTDRGNIYNVTIHTLSGPFYVDKLEVEFNRRKGIHAFYGFHRDAYDQLVTVSFRELERVEFFGPMPASSFDQAIIGREELNLRLDQAFEVRLYFKDKRQIEFYAIIPKLRGEKDLELWEFSLNSSHIPFEYIEFDR